MKYRSRLGHVYSDRDANIIGSFIAKTFPSGQYTNRDVMNAARPKSSPINRYFDWDVQRAAEKHWLRQASKLITCYYVMIENVPAPAAVSVRLTSGRTYMKTENALLDVDLWAEVLKDAVTSLSQWKRRYQTLKQLRELKPVIQAITKLEARHGKENRT